MAYINLLPWREELRNEKKREFVVISGGAAIVTALVFLLVHIQIAGMIDWQMQRNAYIEQATSKLDEKIKEIQELNKVRTQLLARMNVIQELQGSRSLSVHLLDELVTTVPEGLNLSSFKQDRDRLEMSGVAQSNARVSAYMRSIERSDWMKKPVLDVIESEELNRHRIAQFSLHALQESKREDSGVEE